MPKPKPKPRIQDAVASSAFGKSWEWDKALLRVLGDVAIVPGVKQVLDLCDTGQGLSPPSSWRKKMAALLADNAAGADALRTVALRETPFDGAGPESRVPFVCGVVWAVALTEPATAVPLLIHITELYGRPGRGRPYRSVAVTAVRALGWIGGEHALPALRRIRAEAKLGDVRRAASGELDKTLGERHLTRADVPEWQAETFGLGRDGLRDIEVEVGYPLTIELAADGTVTSFHRGPGGRRVKRPANRRTADGAGHAAKTLATEVVAAEIVAELQTVVYAERFRLKQLMQDQRTLTYEDWMEFYLGNAVTGRLCQGLVWASSVDGGVDWRLFLPVWSKSRETWLRLGADGVTHDISEQALVRVVDPKHFGRTEQRAWVARLRTIGVKQPFKQFEVQ